MEFVRSTQGNKELVVLDGYIYRAQNTAENTRDVLSGAVAGQDEETLAHSPE